MSAGREVEGRQAVRREGETRSGGMRRAQSAGSGSRWCYERTRQGVYACERDCTTSALFDSFFRRRVFGLC